MCVRECECTFYMYINIFYICISVYIYLCIYILSIYVYTSFLRIHKEYINNPKCMLTIRLSCFNLCMYIYFYIFRSTALHRHARLHTFMHTSIHCYFLVFSVFSFQFQLFFYFYFKGFNFTASIMLLCCESV